eukprot:3176419-Pyramimonas_sp.AAC.1
MSVSDDAIDQYDAGESYTWAWCVLDLEWIAGDTRAKHPAPPLPIAVLDKPIDTHFTHLASLTALWH